MSHPSPVLKVGAQAGEPSGVAGRIDRLADWMASGSQWRIRVPLLACLALDVCWGFWATFLAVAFGVGGHAVHDGLQWLVEAIYCRDWSRGPMTAFRAWGNAQRRLIELLPESWRKSWGRWPGISVGIGAGMTVALLILGGVWISWCVSMAAGRALAKRPDLARAVLLSGRNPLLIWRLGAGKWPDLMPWFMDSDACELKEAPGSLRRYALLRPQLGDIACWDAIGWRRIHQSEMEGELSSDWLAQALGDAESAELAKSVPPPARSASAKRI